jgi:hypothetical protein
LIAVKILSVSIFLSHNLAVPRGNDPLLSA